jgi:hypothetical protein
VDDRAELVCEAVTWVSDDPSPGWIEVVMTDVDGRAWRFFDKPPIFSPQVIARGSTFPVPVAIRVRIVEDGDPALVTTAADGVESEEGEHLFRVPASSLRR